MDFSNPQVTEALSGFVTLALKAIIVAAVPVLVALLRDWALAKIAEFKNRLSAQQSDLFRDIVNVAISAAEKSGLSGIIADEAAAKRKLAIDTVQAIIESRGWKIPVEEIVAEIERQVHLGLHKVVEGEPLDFAAPPTRAGMGFYTQSTVQGIPVDAPNEDSGQDAGE